MNVSVTISNYAQTTRTLDELDFGPASINADDIDAFMNQPIQLFVKFEDYVIEQDVDTSSKCPDKTPYDLSGHPDAETVVAQLDNGP